MTKRRTYTKEFKIEAVELADKIDNSAQAERDLGIPHGQIYKWRKKLNEEGEPEWSEPDIMALPHFSCSSAVGSASIVAEGRYLTV